MDHSGDDTAIPMSPAIVIQSSAGLELSAGDKPGQIDWGLSFLFARANMLGQASSIAGKVSDPALVFMVRLPNGKRIEIVASPTAAPACRHVYEFGDPAVSTIHVGVAALGSQRIAVDVCEACVMAPLQEDQPS